MQPDVYIYDAMAFPYSGPLWTHKPVYHVARREAYLVEELMLLIPKGKDDMHMSD